MEKFNIPETIYNYFMTDTNAKQGDTSVYKYRDQMHLVKQGTLLAIKVVGSSNITINPAYS